MHKIKAPAARDSVHTLGILLWPLAFISIYEYNFYHLQSNHTLLTYGVYYCTAVM